MILKLDGQLVELDWKGAAILLALYWVKVNALSLSMLHSIEPDYGRLHSMLEKLESLHLVGVVKMKRGTLIYLTERGAEVAGELEKKAVELGLT